MKLLMVSGDRSVLAGRQGAFFSTLEEFSKHWERIDVICPHAPHSPHGHEPRLPLFENVYFHPSPRGLWYQSRWIWRRGLALIKLHHHDVMTVHEYPPFYNGKGAEKLHRKTGIPYALEIHHIVGWPLPASRAERIGRFLSRRRLPKEAKRATAVRTVNAEAKKTLVEWGVPEEKISIVPSFYLDASLLKIDARAPKQFDFVTACRLAPNKGLIQLIEALADVPHATLLIIGDGPMRSKLEKKAKGLGIARRVHFTGWLSKPEHVIRMMQRGRIFVMNSLSEGGPRVALEAMACGMPVIATNVGVMPEVIREGVNGFFAAFDHDDLARTMRFLIRDVSLQKKIGRAAREVVKKFERKKLIRNYAEFLKELARSN